MHCVRNTIDFDFSKGFCLITLSGATSPVLGDIINFKSPSPDN